MNIVEQICEELGGQHELARCLNISKQAINKWVARGVVPAARCSEVSELTNNKFTVQEMNPEVFGKVA